MKAYELRDMTVEELERHLYETKDKLFELRNKKAMGGLENPMEIRKTKREIARIKTILLQKKKE